MKYRVCKSFEVESGHMLLKHPGRCRFPHGHSRQIDIVVSSTQLDANDMVCDFKALKIAVQSCVDAFDHSMAINSQDPVRLTFGSHSERVVLFKDQDPTTEVMARHIFEEVKQILSQGKQFLDQHGNPYHLPATLVLERVRVSETSSSWAEYGIE